MADVQAVYNAFAIFNTGEAPVTGPRTLTAQITDGDNGTSNISTKTVNFTATNDAPTWSNLGGSILYNENGAGEFIHAAVSVNDVDSTNFDGGLLRAEFLTNGTANDWLRIIPDGTVILHGTDVLVGGTTIGAYSGGHNGSDLLVNLNANANPANVSLLARRIAYANTVDNPSTAIRSARFFLQDGDGGTSAPANQKHWRFCGGRCANRARRRCTPRF